jgi:CheY-like chemotaxis protein
VGGVKGFENERPTALKREDVMEAELQGQMIQSGGRSSFEELIPDLVHKLNGPLASVLGYTQLLLGKVDDPQVKEDVEKIIEEAQRASQIVRGLVIFARKRKPQKEALDINDLVERVLERKVHQLNLRNIRVVKELPPSLPVTRADPKQIQQILLDLISNAEEAITEFHGFGEVRVKTSAEGGQIKIVISDDGPGIPEQDLPKIFDPLFTTKDKGTGLGLSISNDIILEHGGTFQVESTYGQGATFTVALPVLEIAEKEKLAIGKWRGQSLKGMRGLVIDDEPTILDLLFRFLQHEGCDMKTALDVKTALETMETHDFDFVICDLKMPGMGGADFYWIMKEKKPSLLNRIIFATGDVLSDATQDFAESVTTPFIEKPFNLGEMKKILLERIQAPATEVGQVARS